MEKMIENCGGVKLPKMLELIKEEDKDAEVSEQLRRGENAEAAEKAEEA